MASNLELRIAISLLEMFPPREREALLESAKLEDRFDLRTDATMTLGHPELGFKRSSFFDAVRRLYAGEEDSVEEIASDSGDLFTIRFQGPAKQELLLESEDEEFVLPSLWPLSRDGRIRVERFQDDAEKANLHPRARLSWRARLGQSALNDDEVGKLFDALASTPSDISTRVRAELQKDSARVDVMVPKDPLYYELLVGAVSDEVTIERYTEKVIRAFVPGLLRWHPWKGILQALALAGHPLVVDSIPIDERSLADIENLFKWIEQHGDRFSQVAAFELGARIAPRFPTIQGAMEGIAAQVKDDDTKDVNGRMWLTCSLFVFVDGELSRVGIGTGKPPFWRRMASIAQAAIIERELLALGAPESFSVATQGRGPRFFMQTLADLRLEPRWLPDMMNPAQLRLEFLNRICLATLNNRDNLSSDNLKSIVLGEADGSVRSQLSSPLAYMPGPLEGGAEATRMAPDDALHALKQASVSGALEASSFSDVIRYAMSRRLQPEVAPLIVELLRRAKYRMSFGQEAGVTFGVLVGLAAVAGVTRSEELAREVRVFCRVLRRREGVEIDIDNQMRIALIASAAVGDVKDWCQFAGDWLTELANEDIRPEMASVVRRHLRMLCSIVPDLWPFVVQSDAALALAERLPPAA